MMNCIINEIIEEWKIYYKSITNKDLFKKVRKILYTNYLNKKRQNSFGSIKRRCSIKTLGSDQKFEGDRIIKNYRKQNTTKKITKLVKKQKNLETTLNKKGISCSGNLKTANAIDIIMGEPPTNDDINNVEMNNKNLNITSDTCLDKLIKSENLLQDKVYIKEIKNDNLKPKKNTRSKKNPVVLRRNNKKQNKKVITVSNINEKLEFIKLGRKSVDKIKENIKIEDIQDMENDNICKNMEIIAGRKQINNDKENLSNLKECNKIENVIINEHSVNDKFKEATFELVNEEKEHMKKENVIEALKTLSSKTFSKASNLTCIDDKTTSLNCTSDYISNNEDKILQENIISGKSEIKPLKIKDIKKENDLLKKLFKKEKSKLEVKRNSVFLENKKDDFDVDKIIKQVFKKEKFSKSPIKQEFASKVDLKVLTDVKKKTNFTNVDIEKNLNEIKLENRKIELPRINKISQVVNENNKIYDVKSSKYIRDSPRSKNDLYKKVIDSQRKCISQNEYKSSTVIPHIKSDDEDSLLFIEPEYCKDANLTNIICKQNHEVLEEYFNLCNDINVEEIFPNIKDISNDSPNKWM